MKKEDVKLFLLSLRYYKFDENWKSILVKVEPIVIKESFEEASLEMWELKDKILQEQEVLGISGKIEEIKGEDFLRVYSDMPEVEIDKVDFSIEEVPYR